MDIEHKVVFAIVLIGSIFGSLVAQAAMPLGDEAASRSYQETYSKVGEWEISVWRKNSGEWINCWASRESVTGRATFGTAANTNGGIIAMYSDDIDTPKGSRGEVAIDVGTHHAVAEASGYGPLVISRVSRDAYVRFVQAVLDNKEGELHITMPDSLMFRFVLADVEEVLIDMMQCAKEYSTRRFEKGA